MENFSLKNVTANIFFDKRRPKNGTNLYPVKFRVNFKGIRKLYPADMDISEVDWEDLQDPTKKSARIKELRQKLRDGFRIITDGIDIVFQHNRSFTFELLDQNLGKKEAKSIDDLFAQTIDELRKMDRIGNANAYEYAYQNIRQFNENKTLMPSDITVSFLKKYEKYETDRGNSFGNVAFCLRELRSILNTAKKNFLITQDEYPFGKEKYQIPTSDAQAKALSKDQIRQLMEYPVKEGSLNQMYLNLWLFSYLANGLNINDLCKLKYTKLVDGEVSFLRKKTILTSKKKKTIYIPLNPFLISVIERWGNKDKTGYIFPFLPKKCSAEVEKEIVNKLTHSINQTMRRIGKKLELGKISANTARHSYATNLVKSNVDPAYIADSLGHTSLKSTEVYFASSTKEERKIQNSKLL